MADMKQIIYKEAKERLMVGLGRETSFFEAGNVWKEFFEGGAIEKLGSLSDSTCCEDIDPNAGIGMMYNFKDMNNFEFIIGDFININTEIPEGLTAKHIPAGLTAHIQIEGSNVAEILDSAYLLITEAIEKTGKQIDQEQFDFLHKLTCERLITFFENQKFTYGQAQKWINMSIKYVSMFNHKMTEKYYEYCHIPIDNYIIHATKYRFNTAWSKIDSYDEYINFQKWFRNNYDGIPLDIEFNMWLNEK